MLFSLLGAANGQLDGPALFSLVMITLLNLAVVYWVVAHLWRSFVLHSGPETDPPAQRETDSRGEVDLYTPF